MGPHLSSSVFGYTKIISRLKKKRDSDFWGPCKSSFQRVQRKKIRKRKKERNTRVSCAWLCRINGFFLFWFGAPRTFYEVTISGPYFVPLIRNHT